MPMPPISSPQENWRLALKYISQCPICGTQYQDSEARLGGKIDHANLVHITCLKCGSYFMALVMEMSGGISSLGTVTDLNFEDVKRTMTLPAISLDEAIAAHDFIKQFDFKF